jgi:5-methyltetrahydrofolate--homocysteine methyltransferase
MSGRTPLAERILAGPMLLDGAMGTQLLARCGPAKCTELLCLEQPGAVEAVHRLYLDAGSHAVLTNTFGASVVPLAGHGLERRLEEINSLAAAIARTAAGDRRYVIGDIGPSGGFLEPVGELSPGQLLDSFGRQARALAGAGVDGFMLETFSDPAEAVLAAEAVRAASDVPFFLSFAFNPVGDEFRTMTGADPQQAASAAAKAGASAVGFNCGAVGSDDAVRLAGAISQAVRAAGIEMLASAEPNAGLPEIEDGGTVYRLQPEPFGDMIAKILAASVSILGGCCGTGPEHIAAAANAISKHRAPPGRHGR